MSLKTKAYNSSIFLIFTYGAETDENFLKLGRTQRERQTKMMGNVKGQEESENGQETHVLLVSDC